VVRLSRMPRVFEILIRTRNNQVRSVETFLESVDAFEQGQPGVLDDLFGCLSGRDIAARDPLHHRRVVVDERCEHPLVAGSQGRDKLVLGVVHDRHRPHRSGERLIAAGAANTVPGSVRAADIKGVRRPVAGSLTPNLTRRGQGPFPLPIAVTAQRSRAPKGVRKNSLRKGMSS